MTRSQAVANSRPYCLKADAHFQGKLFVRLLGIPRTKLRTKFEVSSSSSFGDMFDSMPKLQGSHDPGVSV